MMHRRQFLFLATAAALAGSIPASNAASTSLQDIQAAIASGEPILIHVTAPWCGTCKIQKPIVAELLTNPHFKDLKKIDVDFDSQGDVLKAFKVQTQATMIVFKNGKEVDREVGQTNREGIAEFFEKVV